MGTYVLVRFLQMLLVLVGATVVLFVCFFVAPGDPVATAQGELRAPDPATRAALARRHRLDDPLPKQYVRFLSTVMRGDLGESYRSGRPVSDILRQKLPNSLKLAAAALGFQLVVGVGVGVFAAWFRSSFLDVLVAVATALAIGIPSAVVGLVLQNFFALNLQWFPLQGHDEGWRSIVLPAITLGSANAAVVSRVMRASTVEALHANYVLGARARGLPARVVVGKHVVRNSIVPVLTYLGVGFGALLGGAPVIEAIFNWDGLGLTMVTAIVNQDNPVVLGVFLYSVVAFVLVNLLVDVCYGMIDPRIRIGVRR